MPWDILGHDWAINLLRRDLALDRLGHAYLFSGPPGVGKRTLASTFSQALLCQSPDPPCGACRHCLLAAKDSHPDLLTVSPVVSGKRILSAKIKIDAIREVNYALSLRPVEAKRRVARLIQFDAAEAPAQNAFLKTLEEPPGNAVILITTPQPEELLPTITSRCEVLQLRPLPIADVRAALGARWGIPEPQAELLAHLSGGRPGWAVRMHAGGDALEDRSERLDELRQLLSAGRAVRFAYADELAKSSNSDHIQAMLELWLAFLRDLLLTSLQSSAPLVNPDRAADFQELSARIPPSRTWAGIRATRRTMEAMRRNANLRLALEVLMLDLPRLSP